MRLFIIAIALLLTLTACEQQQLSPNKTASQLLQVDYSGGFTVWLDCEKNGATKFRYNAQRDGGNAERASRFTVDSNVPADCQQTTGKSYRRADGGVPTYDRGHLVPANHMDHSKEAITQTNHMTNILPQVSTMNRGAWLQTEEIVECYRDIDELLVIGGTIWGNNPADDYFLKSHGVPTPDAFWKVIIRGSGQSEKVIAWLIPNSQEATRSKLDSYLISVRKLESMIGERLPVAEYSRDETLSQSWVLPVGCDKS